MAVSSDISATYRRPAETFRRLFSREQSEPRALAYLLGACLIMFVAQWPVIARRVYLSAPEQWAADPQAFRNAVQPEIGGALMGGVIFLPLLFYVLALILFWLARLLRGNISAYDARLSVFWSLLAAAPLALLNGLVAGFIGAGAPQLIVGALWFGVFLWFVGSGMRTAHKTSEGEAA